LPKKSTYKPGFIEDKPAPNNKPKCRVIGCGGVGEYKAPISRTSLDEYIWLCLAHVVEYNKAWDYLKGMKEEEIFDFQKSSVIGHRPTWKFGVGQKSQDEFIREVFTNLYYTTTPSEDKVKSAKYNKRPLSPKERKALDVLGLDGPVDMSDLKKRYKELVKLNHPDVNQKNPGAEEKFKKIQEAFNVLKKLWSSEG